MNDPKTRLIRKIPHALTTALLLASIVTGCTKKQPATAETSPVAEEQSLSPLDTAADGNSLTAKITTAGIAAKYTAHFDADKLTRIEETRTADGRQAAYEFYGARLLRYSGAATASAATLALEFDMQGGVMSAKATPGPLAESEISAARNRAQLLRSHALAQRSTRAHSMH